MGFLEKYRDYSLISKILAYVLFFDAGTSVLGMFINMIRFEYYSFSIWTILYQAVPVIAGIIFLMNKHQDKIFKYAFSGALVLMKLIVLIRAIALGSPTFKYILTCFMGLVLAVGFAAYYLGVIRPAGKRNYLICMYILLGVAALFSIFNIGSVSIDKFALCALLAMFSYQETRAQNPTIVYAGMIGLAYYLVYMALGDLLGLFSVYMPGFFNSVNIILCMAVPLLVYDRVVPGEGQSLALDFSVFSGAAAPTYQQPMQQNGYQQPMQQNGYQQPAQPVQNNNFRQANAPVQNNNFQQANAPVQNNNFRQTNAPVQNNNFQQTNAPAQNMYQQTNIPTQTNAPAQQNNFDPMTGQPLNAQPQQNRFDPMTGEPLDPNGGQQ